LPKFKETDFQFHTDIASTGYKKYYSHDDLDNVTCMLFESKLSQKIQTKVENFNKTERLNLLEESIRTVMNMVPHDMESFRT